MLYSTVSTAVVSVIFVSLRDTIVTFYTDVVVNQEILGDLVLMVGIANAPILCLLCSCTRVRPTILGVRLDCWILLEFFGVDGISINIELVFVQQGCYSQKSKEAQDRLQVTAVKTKKG
jgi:hypothetical protein